MRRNMKILIVILIIMPFFNAQAKYIYSCSPDSILISTVKSSELSDSMEAYRQLYNYNSKNRYQYELMSSGTLNIDVKGLDALSAYRLSVELLGKKVQTEYIHNTYLEVHPCKDETVICDM